MLEQEGAEAMLKDEGNDREIRRYSTCRFTKTIIVIW